MQKDIQIVFEDDAFVVIDKPPGIVVNNAQSVKTPTIQDWAHARYFQNIDTKDHDYYARDGVVHRLDKDTSGVMLLAKSKDAFENLQAQFKQRLVKKTYHALVHGTLVPVHGEIDVPVGRLPWNRERFGVVPKGKPSKTCFTVLATYSKKIAKQQLSFSYVEFYPETGRTHQIRVHAKYLNHPLVADHQYAGRKTFKRDSAWAPRVMLHARSIAFDHPHTHERVTYIAPLPEDFSSVIAFLSS